MKREQDLKNQRKNIFIENQEEDFELSEYNIVVEEHFFWQDRGQITLFMKNFLNKKSMLNYSTIKSMNFVVN